MGRGRKQGDRVGPYAGRSDKPTTSRTKQRAATGMTMSEFAVFAGVSERTLRNWESGAGTPKLDTLVRIEDALRRRAPRQHGGKAVAFERDGKFFVRIGDDRASMGPIKTRSEALAYANELNRHQERP